ncbi:hypothetical protein J6590_001649 [Homalodisca vitripennis]|nr:hypothetical protein J6590_001649 [Homalodisca vitripennis]
MAFRRGTITLGLLGKVRDRYHGNAIGHKSRRTAPRSDLSNHFYPIAGPIAELNLNLAALNRENGYFFVFRFDLESLPFLIRPSDFRPQYVCKVLALKRKRPASCYIAGTSNQGFYDTSSTNATRRNLHERARTDRGAQEAVISVTTQINCEDNIAHHHARPCHESASSRRNDRITRQLAHYPAMCIVVSD